MLEKNELLPWLINTFNCKQGIEIGVRDGDNLKRLLSLTSIYMHGVDIQKWPQVVELENKYLNRFTFLHTYSIHAATLFPDNFFDLIYIDANHNYPAVCEDLYTWYPKLKIGGVFSGDDYCNCWNPQEGQYGVVQAVEEFIADKNVRLYVSGVRSVDKEVRIAYANQIGKLHEDNFTGRKRTEGVPVPQWWFIKED